MKLILLVVLICSTAPLAQALEPIRVSADKGHFVIGDSTDRFIAWGVNYDHDSAGRLLDEYWVEEWPTVVEDFAEIKSLGANCVRVHFQVGKFMDAPDRPNAAALAQLAKLLRLAEDTGLYLDITGLACYHKKNIPAWYDGLDEAGRWTVQATFWEAIARVAKDSPAVFCYDLMNEPILPGATPVKEWLTGELGGKFFVQQLTLDLKGRTREQVAGAWVNTMVDAIRKHDESHMVTVGVIPWVFVFGGGKPLFHSPEVGQRLDFVAVHFYPKKGEVEKAVTALQAYNVGKPLVIEEMFPLACTEDELAEFIERSSGLGDGWISFYWGEPAAVIAAKEKPTIGEAITRSWLTRFEQLSSGVKSGKPTVVP
ncbi:MAG: cellulase family glycosylhydrolase [Planctomycetaceae bacterium]